MPSRRAVIAALLGGGVGAATLTDARGYLNRFAPLSGDAWGAATADTRERVATPYGEATVRYDDAGVPTVAGDDELALYFAVGYVHAADRLFEMDLIRRRMRGTLSAAVGERTVDSDRFHAQMDFAAAAEASWRAVEDTPTGEAMRAYAAGVEAQRTSEPLPLEFRLLDYEPAAWTPVDSMLVEKQISWGLTGSFRSLRRSVAADALGEPAAATLYPDRMDHDVPVLRGETAPESASGSEPSSGAADARGEPDLASLSAWLADFESGPGIGSNSWLVSGEHTASGEPLLANDPHLNLMAPPVWYQMGQRRPGMRVRGVTFPGVPFVVIGENDAGAWGFTNAGADVLDTYTYETRDGEYRYGDEWREFDTEERTIEVAGGDDRTVTVRKSVHGPVLEREGRQVGVAWTGLQASRTAVAVHELDRSGGREEALAALSKFDTPTQNAVYADRDGNTAYWVTGLIPVRESGDSGGDGTSDGGGEGPVRGDRVFDGSAREGEWPGYEPYGEPDFETGWIPFDEKPGVRDPDYLATANQRIADDPDRYLGEGYAAPFRARRIYDLLDERAASDDPFDFAHMRRVQRDVVDERARLFVPAILDARDAMDDAARAAADRLEGWDYRMNRDSRAALVFELFVGHYRERVFEPVLDAAGLDESHYPNDWVLLTLGPESRWFTDPPAEGVDSRSRRDLIAAAMADAAAEIDVEGYETYGDYNRTAIDHPFDLAFLNYPRLPTDGSPATVRNFRRESAVGSSFRLLSRFDGEPSLGMIPGGNDGEYFSDHYSDLLEAWADGEYRPLVATTDGDPDIRFETGDADAAGGAGDE
ncbi:penicillin acylase family protein [Halosimplex pelagicum]|uniref:Penicillin acylase family protein n=1 Tax=Halosimplex pelagicum TaxID=869886 RepID=A0A7D5TIT6_9EURY|nr:penicillin acylase family protein [Halosimplex pelagicum]QLH84236.1 penicillin acylase family protein [Halosimplex pelagicum]